MKRNLQRGTFRFKGNYYRFYLSAVSLLLFLSYSATLYAQPVISTEDSPVWFKIESACTDPVTLGGAYTGPTDLTGYVLYDPASSDNRIYARVEQGGDAELWAMIEADGIVKLKNKATNRYMTGSHSLNDVGENVSYGTYGSDQYWIKSGTQNTVVIWNNLKCDRLSGGRIDSNTAFYIRVQSDTKSILGALINSAISLKSEMTGTNPGYILPDGDAVITFDEAIAGAEAVYNSVDESPDYQSATDQLEAAIVTFKSTPVNTVVVSTETNETWYFFESAAINDYCAGKVINDVEGTLGVVYNFADKQLNPRMLWKIVDAGNNQYAFVNMASGLYFGKTGESYTGVQPSETPVAYNVEYLGERGQFVIKEDGALPLHCQQNGSKIVTWDGGLDSPSAWRFVEVDDASAPISITSLTVRNGLVSTGIGNVDFAATYFTMEVEGLTGSSLLDQVNVALEGTTNLSDIENIRIYYLGNDIRFDPEVHPQVASSSELDYMMQINPDADFEVPAGSQNFAVVVDVTETANEGDKIKISVESVALQGSDVCMAQNPDPAYEATIFLTQSTLFSPGDYGSQYYRIPAIVTANDGTLVAATDRRKNNISDLPGDIDVYISRSADKGKTWSEPLMIAGENTDTGYGDPALVVEKESGKIFCFMAHDKGFFASTPADPIRITVCESSDNGASWTEPRDITDNIYGAGCSNATSKNWDGVFVSSGRGLQLRNGRLILAMAVRDGSGGINNYALYSDDKGENWTVNTNLIHSGGDEAKFVQRNNGDVVISIRNGGHREWNVSTDNGDTWGTSTIHQDLVDPACNGEILNYTSTLDGYEKNRMLHSLAYASSRVNVSLLLSYDEGETFPIVKTICPASSAYSVITKLDDGTIGVYYEDGSVSQYDLVYVRVSLDWLTDGQDQYSSPMSTAVDDIINDAEDIIITVSDGQVFVKNKKGEVDYQIFDISGKKLQPNRRLKTGIYIVRTENLCEKVMIL
ncbi:sialidase family protein [Mangrovibacterium marinum]|uniref:exo-alpha-sialidase n=1 Tax=Mangrovibacterium marinum TaxID=1639118 RepID=A0A2T5C0U1_9BACT|nr:sialidase family protein [Mangrovibacterium marinum]PTN08198.1 neuraminidase-like protein [Mangrovibacterium marinum]